MNKRMSLWAIMFAAVILAGCGDATTKGKVLADVNGNKITEGTLDFLGDINPRIKAQIASPAGRKRILDNLVEQNLLYQEAVKEGINRNPQVKAKVDLYRRVIIAQSLMEKEIEDAAKKYYEDNPEEFKKLRLSQIMVKYSTPEEIKKAKQTKKKGKQPKLHTEKQALNIAQTIKAKLDKGEGFEKVAQESSEDLATKSRGGDLGLVSKDDQRLEARGYGPLLEKAFEMKVGEISGPIKTSKGYHIITVTRGVELEPFEEAQRAIIIKIRNDARQNLLARLKKDATIVYPEEERRKKELEKARKEQEEKAAEAKKAAEEKKAVEVSKEGTEKEVKK